MADIRLLRQCIRKYHDVTIGSPNPGLVSSYLAQSKEAIVAMDTLSKVKANQWVVETSYYAKYFVVLALLAKIGIRSKNHTCTAEFFEYLFGATNPTLVAELKTSRGNRVDAVYNATTTGIDFRNLIPQTKVFATEVGRVITGLNATEVARLRGQLSRL